ncbi:hypothetical protein [Streptomyces sp. NPDC127098]|uniref:hypothetical protein n=1 Tax=Streptomyces sp. NPDC127098 TaxID=3347137 RepID=UPI003666CA63
MTGPDRDDDREYRDALRRADRATRFGWEGSAARWSPSPGVAVVYAVVVMDY